MPDDPYRTLGLQRGASAADIRRARNRLAKELHPDIGGTNRAMQAINEAAEAALAEAAQVAPPPAQAARPSPGRRPQVWRDHPSFTVEVLPVEAFEGLLIACAILGQVVDDDAPYRLDAVLDEPPDVWCRLDLVPDGGGSTVSITLVADAVELSDHCVADVRDRLVAELNQLDWADEGPRRPRPW